MSIDEQLIGCVNLCTATATQIGSAVDLTGVCDFSPAGFTMLSVNVTACRVESVEFQAVSADTILLAVRTQVDFDFTGVRPDGTSFRGSASCESVIQSLISAAEGQQFFQPPRCSAELTCSASDAGTDPVTGVQSFVVTVTGIPSCVECTPDVVNVRRCATP